MSFELLRIVKSDAVKALHDAPGDCLMLVLRGGFTEHRFAYMPIENVPLPPIVQRKRGLFSFAFIRAEVALRAQLFQRKDGSEGSALMLLFHFKPRRNAGFWAARQGELGHQAFQTTLQHGDGSTEGLTIATNYVDETIAQWVPTQLLKEMTDA